MSDIKRFLRGGADDADRRVASWLSAPSYDAADEHLKQSAIVRAIDRSTLHLSAWWNNSQSRRVLADLFAEFAAGEAVERYRAVGAIVMIAAVVHVAMSLTHGPRPGWFWLVLPAMALAFALPLLTATRKEPRSN